MIPSPTVKIQNLLEVIRQNIVGDVNKFFVFKILLTTPSNVLPLHLKQIFPPIIFTEGDGIKSRLSFKIFSTLQSTYVLSIYLPCFEIWISYLEFYRPLCYTNNFPEQSFHEFFIKEGERNVWKKTVIHLKWKCIRI